MYSFNICHANTDHVIRTNCGPMKAIVVNFAGGKKAYLEDDSKTWEYGPDFDTAVAQLQKTVNAECEDPSNPPRLVVQSEC